MFSFFYDNDFNGDDFYRKFLFLCKCCGYDYSVKIDNESNIYIYIAALVTKQNSQCLFCHSRLVSKVYANNNTEMIVKIFDTAVVLYFIKTESTAYMTRGYRAENIMLCTTARGRNDIIYNKQEQDISNFHIKPTKYDLYIRQSYDL